MNESIAQSSSKKSRRELRGIVVSHADKTAVVRVDSFRMHEKYRKHYAVSATFMAHDETNAVKVGDTVTIVEGRPRSRHKRWEIITSVAPV